MTTDTQALQPKIEAAKTPFDPRAFAMAALARSNPATLESLRTQDEI